MGGGNYSRDAPEKVVCSYPVFQNLRIANQFNSDSNRNSWEILLFPHRKCKYIEFKVNKTEKEQSYMNDKKNGMFEEWFKL